MPPPRVGRVRAVIGGRGAQSYHAPPHAPRGPPAGPHPRPPPTRGRCVRFGPVAPLGRGHAGDRPAGGPFLHFAAALQGLRWRVWGCREAPARTRSTPVDGAQGCSASGCRAWAHRATGRCPHACRSRLRTAVSVTVTFRGCNITRRGSNHPVTPTPDPARPGGIGEHQRRPALRLPASSTPPNIGQMRILNQVPSIQRPIAMRMREAAF